MFNKLPIPRSFLILIIAAFVVALVVLAIPKQNPPVIQPTPTPTLIATTSPTPQSTAIPTPTSTITPTPTPSIDVSDWKTYRNDRYGYEFQYPSEVFLNSYDEVGNGTKITDDAVDVAAQHGDTKGIFSVSGVNISFTLDGIRGQFGATNKEDISVVPVRIAGVDGYQVVSTKIESTDNQKILSDIYFIKKNNQVFSLTVLKNNEIANRMLSSFKFIN